MLRLNKTSKKTRVGITMGDPSGVGPEIIIKALNEPSVNKLADFIIIGDRWVFGKIQNSPVKEGSRKMREKSKIQNYNFIDLNNVPHKNFSFGKVKAEYGRASIEYIDRALELLKNDELDCLVTSPVSKEAIRLAGFNFSGHTEYLARFLNVKYFVMMLLNKELKISLVTRHTPIKEVALEINKNKIYKTVFLTNKYLKKLFLIKNPRMVACGLNPHASDNGLIGNEEMKIVKPVLRKLRNLSRVRIDGPLSADVAILKTKQKKYDCVIAMYHDQALIPLKLLDSNSGVNITLGLPFVRTSPLHGTAFDIAGKSIASPGPFIDAIKLAVRCTSNLKKD
jgi:4-hydroxythreonine-4-phosphate dehydrogenase